MSTTNAAPLSGQPRASIVVLCYNGLEEITRPCINSILENTPPDEYELILVDNASVDRTPDFLRDMAGRHTHVKLCLNETNKGYAAGNNDGIHLATGRSIILLNNDTLVPKGWLDRLLRLLEEDNDIGLAGPVTNSAGNEQRLVIPGLDESNFEAVALPYLDRQRGLWFKTEKLGFYCVAIRRAAYEAIGDLDDGFGLGMFEDDDYCLRAHKAGFASAIVEDCFVYHKGSVSFGKLASEDYLKLFAKNRRFFFEKHGVVWRYSSLLESAWARVSADIGDHLRTPTDSATTDRIAARLPVVTDMIYRIHALGVGNGSSADEGLAEMMLQAKHKEQVELSIWAADLRDRNEQLVADFMEKQAKLMEISDWATQLSAQNKELHSEVLEKQNRVAEISDRASQLATQNKKLHEQILEKQSRLMEVSDWASQLATQNKKLHEQILEKQSRLIEVSDWASEIKVENEELASRVAELEAAASDSGTQGKLQ
jgi:GT2 family glycosyltransferase